MTTTALYTRALAVIRQHLAHPTDSTGPIRVTCAYLVARSYNLPACRALAMARAAK